MSTYSFRFKATSSSLVGVQTPAPAGAGQCHHISFEKLNAGGAS